MSTLQYYFEDGSHVIFNKYTITNGVIINKKGAPVAYSKCVNKYNRCGVYDDDGKQRKISVGRAIASTIHGPPPSPGHTADHIDRNPANDTDGNIRWLCKTGQQTNRNMSEDNKSALIIVKDMVEKTAKEWVEHFREEKNHMGHEYTSGSIAQYARRKKHGFSYKEYPDLSGEVWKEVVESGGTWKISDMNRVKYITKHAENVLSGERLGMSSGYPKIRINGQEWYCHILAFMTFFPKEYAAKTPGEIVLHEDDDRIDFRPHKLRLGTVSENACDAHNNGKYDGTKSMRSSCVSYINGIFEKEFKSQSDAVRYLKSNGYLKASVSSISIALDGKLNSAYDRTWKKVV